jgi:hypothetical protein
MKPLCVLQPGIHAGRPHHHSPPSERRCQIEHLGLAGIAGRTVNVRAGETARVPVISP